MRAWPWQRNATCSQQLRHVQNVNLTRRRHPPAFALVTTHFLPCPPCLCLCLPVRLARSWHIRSGIPRLALAAVQRCWDRPHAAPLLLSPVIGCFSCTRERAHATTAGAGLGLYQWLGKPVSTGLHGSERERESPRERKTSHKPACVSSASPSASSSSLCACRACLPVNASSTCPGPAM